MYTFVNNDLIPASKAMIHVSDLSIHRGYGVFDFFKISDGHPFFLEEYLDRFQRSASILRLPIPLDREKIVANIYKLIEKNDLGDSGIKLILTGGYSSDGYLPGKPNLIMTHHALALPNESVFKNGVSIITHEYVRELPSAKTINYSVGIWLTEKLKETNAYDVLYCKDGIVSEFPRCNFFIVTNEGVVVTPETNVLEGITRKNVIHLARERFKAEERAVSMDEVLKAREAFLTSTTKRIVPIVKINDRMIGDGIPGEFTSELLRGLIEMEEYDKKVNQRPKKFYRF